MNREDIIRMAREIGLPFWPTDVHVTIDELQRFAALVAAAEREACAKVCEVGVDYPHPIVKSVVLKNFGGSKLLAAAIRKRGEVKPCV